MRRMQQTLCLEIRDAGLRPARDGVEAASARKGWLAARLRLQLDLQQPMKASCGRRCALCVADIKSQTITSVIDRKLGTPIHNLDEEQVPGYGRRGRRLSLLSILERRGDERSGLTQPGAPSSPLRSMSGTGTSARAARPSALVPQPTYRDCRCVDLPPRAAAGTGGQCLQRP